MFIEFTEDAGHFSRQFTLRKSAIQGVVIKEGTAGACLYLNIDICPSVFVDADTGNRILSELCTEQTRDASIMASN